MRLTKVMAVAAPQRVLGSDAERAARLQLEVLLLELSIVFGDEDIPDIIARLRLLRSALPRTPEVL